MTATIVIILEEKKVAKHSISVSFINSQFDVSCVTCMYSFWNVYFSEMRFPILQVLFQNDSPATLLARVIGIISPIGQDMLVKGRDTYKYFSKNHMLYDRNQVPHKFIFIFFVLPCLVCYKFKGWVVVCSFVCNWCFTFYIKRWQDGRVRWVR